MHFLPGPENGIYAFAALVSELWLIVGKAIL